ncbi:UDP-GlcNAc:betaGal beta-1,3-N-acetylglucosaminyltransferase-like protein 1 [Leguminivora glycinivorella]|uniref:UDP-GlcNAc:betaGal beta-1,3-N-acetylglucosaminyltransferase-like protein 1 n=1 Tax=Leguminivora glycinivorella TaxID=1035111 RepID=UPI00200CD070|nr:UDP-GlcNAc:betaGal beta-1,3-N-acetylglucosaminyltransferase-like protein 1 [Leguminivora glycinivorella]XP_047996220.1 UDP-GlcNAc:betaGal beta-1,3-N-acetylglucosaminyltransferase-like protein 1 [Leguminivora glycinivorella]
MTVVSIIIPVRNGQQWINNCLKSIADQSILNSETDIEIVAYNDGSIDETENLLKQWQCYFKERRIELILTGSTTSRGVGAAKNGAVSMSKGEFLCFQDIDDVMHPDRIQLQLLAAQSNHNAIVGCNICRVPEDSTPRLVRWANNLTDEQLKLQIYTANGPTLLMPTWFCHRSVFEKVGSFDESGKGTPEDLIFFYSHLDLGGDLIKVNKKLLIYTYHEGAATFSVKREMIWQIQLERLQKLVLPNWKTFTIWNAGKAGRRLVRALDQEHSKKVVAFCDVDEKKIGTTVELYCPVKKSVLISLPVINFSDAKPPLLICVKLDMTNGIFEQNLKSMNLSEGLDYILFN